MDESVRVKYELCQTFEWTRFYNAPTRGRGSLSISVYQIVSSRVFICPATLEAPWDAHVNCH